jgi:hypothetical protein
MKITDDLTKKLAKTVAEIMQSAEVKDATRSKKEEEFLKLHMDNVSTVDLSPDEKPFQDPPKQKEEKQTKAAKTVKEEKEEDEEEIDEDHCEMSDNEIEEALSKSAPASAWIKDFVHSKNPKFKGKSKEERIKMALGAYYGQKEAMDESSSMFRKKSGEELARIVGDKRPGSSAARSNAMRELERRSKEDQMKGKMGDEEKMDTMRLRRKGIYEEAAKVLMEAPVKSDQWITELANVVARSSDTKDLAMAFEAWANSLYKTPAWESLQRSPIVGLLIDELATALDVYIGYSAESTAEVEDPQMEEAAGKYALSVDGKIWAKGGKPVHFANAKSAKSAKEKASEKMKDKKIELIQIKEEAEDTTEVENAWKAASNKKAVIAKYNLSSGISSLRPGEIKLGIRNQMNGKRSFAALDNEGQLVIISGTSTAPKIRYVK